MFADGTNIFFTHQDIKYFFQRVNQELENSNQWFISNKLSVNIKKTYFSINPVKTFTKTNKMRLRNTTNRINHVFGGFIG